MGILIYRLRNTGFCSDKNVTKLPFVRGVFAFIDSLVLGMRVTMHSASFYEEEDGGQEKKHQEADRMTL